MKPLVNRAEFPRMSPDSMTRAAQALASRFSLDGQRVHRIMERIDALGGLGPVWPSLEAALRYLEPEEALRLFEQSDLLQLSRRCTFVGRLTCLGPVLYSRGKPEQLRLSFSSHPADFLACFGPSLYGVEELEQVTAVFIPHLRENRDHLVRTGLPRTSCQRAPWLDLLLGNLYYTKRLLCVRSTQVAEDVIEHSYAWRGEGPGTSDRPCTCGRDAKGADHGVLHALQGPTDKTDGFLPDPVPYEEACLIDGLAVGDAARLEASREKLVELKLRILDELLRAVCTRDGSNLWKNCLQMLTEALTFDEADFHLRMDQLYSDQNAFAGRLTAKLVRFPGGLAGGITDMLTAVGHFERECKLQTTTRRREAVTDLVELDHFNRLAPKVYSYFEVVGRPEQAIVDAACEKFRSLESEDEAFWAEFSNRVSEALRHEFAVEVVTRDRVKARFASEFKSWMRVYAEFTKEHLDATGRFPELLIAGRASHEAQRLTCEGQPTFPTPEGTGWESISIAFVDGHTVSVACKGTRTRRRYTYAEMGLTNRTTGNPDKQWELLEDFAKGNGRLGWDSPQASRKLKKRKHRLADGLRLFFGIKEDPFHTYDQGQGWMCRFTLSSEYHT
jgi:predicted secreted protein